MWFVSCFHLIQMVGLKYRSKKDKTNSCLLLFFHWGFKMSKMTVRSALFWSADYQLTNHTPKCSTLLFPRHLLDSFYLPKFWIFSPNSIPELCWSSTPTLIPGESTHGYGPHFSRGFEPYWSSSTAPSWGQFQSKNQNADKQFCGHRGQ